MGRKREVRTISVEPKELSEVWDKFLKAFPYDHITKEGFKSFSDLARQAIVELMEKKEFDWKTELRKALNKRKVKG